MRAKTLVIATFLCALASPALAQQPSSTIVKPGKVIDPVWNGVLIGAGAGAVGAWIFTRVECGPPGYDKECSAITAIAGTAVFVPSGMLIGGIIDRLINKTLPPAVRTSTTVTPIFAAKTGRKSAGVALNMKFRF